MIQEYARSTGRDVSTVGFWHALALWKLAIITADVRQRAMADPNGAALVPPAAGIRDFLERARAVADAARI